MRHILDQSLLCRAWCRKHPVSNRLVFDRVPIRDKVVTTSATPNTFFINEVLPTPHYDNERLVFRPNYPRHQHLSNDQDAEPEDIDEMTIESESV